MNLFGESVKAGKMDHLGSELRMAAKIAPPNAYRTQRRSRKPKRSLQGGSLAKTYQGHACADDENGDPPYRADRFFEADLRHDNDEYVSEAHGWIGHREIKGSERLKV